MFTPTQIIAMTDNEIGTYCSGGYGPAKRTEMIASIRKLCLREAAKAEITESLDRQKPGLTSRLAREFGLHA